MFIFKKKNRFFTLIELIVVIVVIGILAAVVIPNISSWDKEAKITAIKSDIKNVQTGIDTYTMKNDGVIPLKGEITPQSPALVDIEKLKYKYLRNLPQDKDLKFWVDYKGYYWASTADSPSDVKAEVGKVSFSGTTNGKTYNAYLVVSSSGVTGKADSKYLNYLGEVEGKGTLSIMNSTITSDSIIVVSAVDKYGLESAPAGEGYEAASVDSGSYQEVKVDPYTPSTLGTPKEVSNSPVVSAYYLKAVSQAPNELKLHYENNTGSNLLNYLVKEDTFDSPVSTFNSMNDYDFDHKETANYDWQIKLVPYLSGAQYLQLYAENKSTGKTAVQNILVFSGDNVHISKYRNFNLAVNPQENEVAVMHGSSYRDAYLKVYKFDGTKFTLSYDYQFRINRDEDPGAVYYDANGDLYAFAIGNNYLYSSVMKGLKRTSQGIVTEKVLTGEVLRNGRKDYSITEDLNGKLWVFYENYGENYGKSNKSIDYIVVNKDLTVHQNVSSLVKLPASAPSTSTIVQPASFLNKDGSITVFYLKEGKINQINIGK